jgi:hypothetical protein
LNHNISGYRLLAEDVAVILLYIMCWKTGNHALFTQNAASYKRQWAIVIVVAVYYQLRIFFMPHNADVL